MLLKSVLSTTSLPLLVAAWSHANSTANTVIPITAFNLTAITAVNGASVLECWQIALPLTVLQMTGFEGIVIQELGNLDSMVWSSIPIGYRSAPHFSPMVGYVEPPVADPVVIFFFVCLFFSLFLFFFALFFLFLALVALLMTKTFTTLFRYNAILSGTLRITIPNSTQQVDVHGGKYGLVIAADTPDVSKIGHVSSIVGKEELTMLMIPTAKGEIPPHRVIHGGPCEEHDLML